jgi:MoaA/NifB/PqqE/SkfB family radical SAM enzyme
MGRRLIKSKGGLSFSQQARVYAFFMLHKVMYLAGNVLEHRRARTMGAALLSKSSLSAAVSKPEFIILDITHRCNLKCNVCEIRKDKPIAEFTFDEVKGLIDQAINWGVQEFVLSGGEALLRQDIFEILEYVRKRKYRVGVLTNGVILSDTFLERLLPFLSSGVVSLSISLDALSPHIHDDIRGGAGCFEKTARCLQRLSELKKTHPRVNFNTISIILNENLEELPALARHLKALGVNSIQFQPLLANNLIMKERSERAKYWIPPERLGVLDEAIEKLVRFSRDNPGLVRNSENNLRLAKKYFRGLLAPEDVRCLYAERTFLIANNGDATTCFACYGNVRKQQLKDIYFSDAARRAREGARACKSPCLLPCFCDN